jgi:glycerophosphoryl diester phosphodiesterase
MLIVAHRGSSALAPENTLAAFRRAIADGAEGIEFDVRLARDGVVVFHDPSLKRVGTRPEMVSDLTVAELGREDVGTWFNRKFPRLADPRFASETVPTLEEVLELLNDFKGLIYVELKAREPEIKPLTEAVARIVGSSRLSPQIIVKSFQLDVIPQFRTLCPGIRTAALFAPKIVHMLRKEKRLIDVAGDLGADMLSVHYSLATKKLVRDAARRGMPVTVWTADHPLWARRGADLGLYAVITNNPARLLAARAAIANETPRTNGGS